MRYERYGVKYGAPLHSTPHIGSVSNTSLLKSPRLGLRLGDYLLDACLQSVCELVGRQFLQSTALPGQQPATQRLILQDQFH